MSTIKLPGLVDVHTHLRVPGGEHKEDFATGSAAAVAGGVTTVLAMPNTSPPLTTPAAIEPVLAQAAASAYCDIGLFAGAAPAETAHLPAMSDYAVALKIYLNDTFGPLRVEDLPTLRASFQDWDPAKPIAMHAEGQSVAVGIGLAATYQRPVHFCHISRRDEIELIADAKMAGLPVSCEVAPHHLFLDQRDAERLGALGNMRPRLATPDDVAALWAHLNSTIDCIATDHAPHTLAEKGQDSPPPGVPGLETSLALMLTAVQQGRLTLQRVIDLMADNPRRIFNLPSQPDTWIAVDPDETFTVPQKGFFTKCDWSPFAGMTLYGQVQRTVLRGKTVFEQGRLVASPGVGKILR